MQVEMIKEVSYQVIVKETGDFRLSGVSRLRGHRIGRNITT